MSHLTSQTSGLGGHQVCRPASRRLATHLPRNELERVARVRGEYRDPNDETSLVLDTLEMALWARDHHVHPVGEGLVLHSDAGSQFTSFAFTQRLVDAGADPSIGSVGVGYDNALAETTIGLYKTELINRRGPWKTIDQVELATLEWVDWYNHRRLHSACDGLPPVEFEQTRERQITQ